MSLFDRKSVLVGFSEAGIPATEKERPHGQVSEKIEPRNSQAEGCKGKKLRSDALVEIGCRTRPREYEALRVEKMRLTASTCRQQEAVQREIAFTATLENRRKIASDAANAWAKEAIEADKRDVRELKRRLETEAAACSSK